MVLNNNSQDLVNFNFSRTSEILEFSRYIREQTGISAFHSPFSMQDIVIEVLSVPEKFFKSFLKNSEIFEILGIFAKILCFDVISRLKH